MLKCREVLEKLAGGPLPGWETFAKTVTIGTAKAGAEIFAAGDAMTDLHLLRSGLLKLTYLRADGAEWTKSFIEEGMFFSGMAAINSGASPFSASALEAVVFERIPVAGLARLADEDLAWSRAVRNALIAFATRKEQREREFLTLRAEERYRIFAAGNPGLLKRVPQKELAAYLGVTPVGLSRIAGRLRKEKSPAPAG